MSTDSASAYQIHARKFLESRDRSSIGSEVVAAWAQSLEPHAEILEIGCGGGLPVTRAVVNAGHKLWAVDSSPTLLSAFQSRFPGVPVDCSRAQESAYFGRKFDAVITIGLLFLLSTGDQSALIHRVCQVLRPRGRFLFTAPEEIGTWRDMNTGHECRSLGRERYESILTEAGLRPVTTYEDEGRNNYYEAEKIPTARTAA